MASKSRAPDHRRIGSTSAGECSTLLGTALTARQIEAFGRKVTTTATHLIGDPSSNVHYQHAIKELSKELRRPGLQQRVFSYAQASPTEIVRSRLSTTEIQHRALTYLPDELLRNIPVPSEHNTYSLFQGFNAVLPSHASDEELRGRRRGRPDSRRKLLNGADDQRGPKHFTARESHAKCQRELDMLGVRKNMCSAEIREIDLKINNLSKMRGIVLQRLESLEQDEIKVEDKLRDLEASLEDEDQDDRKEPDSLSPARHPSINPRSSSAHDHHTSPRQHEDSFLSQSIYEKLPSPRQKRSKTARRRTNAIRHEHFVPGSSIANYEAHTDVVTAIDFDMPFGTMVSSALDDTVRVWDLNARRCLGLLEGHQASVRCLQIEDGLVATGSMDASIRLWDLDQAFQSGDRDNRHSRTVSEAATGTDTPAETNDEPLAQDRAAYNTGNCHVHTLSAHVAEVTALHMQGEKLVSGSADKTLRQWDLVTGRCIQTLDVLWAAAQATASINPAAVTGSTDMSLPLNSASSPHWRKIDHRATDTSANFVGALQCFDAALACGTADGMVRLWDLRSGQVHRSLVGHTGPITCLQFDERFLVTGSADRSIRLWDLRTGTIRDAYAYENPITSMMFDARRIVAAAGEPVVKVYDKADSHHWDCGEVEGPSTGRHDIQTVRVRDGYLIAGRKDGSVSAWSC